MKKHRISAVLTAAATAAMMAAYMPQLIPAEAAEIVHDDFEVHFGGWCAESPKLIADMTAAEGAGVDGSRALKIVGRTSADDYAFAKQYLYLVGGKEYDYSVKVFAEKAQTFTFALVTTDADGNETEVVIDRKFVEGGEWTELSGSYKAPAGSGLFMTKISTDTADEFLIDEVSIVGEERSAALVAQAAETGIKDWIVNYGIRSGNILNGSTINDGAIKNILLKDCNAIECENETKPDATLSQGGSSGTTVAVRDNSFSTIAKWCADNGLGFRGHTMVWHSQTPNWFFKENMAGDSGNPVSKDTMEKRLENYIKAMFDMYASKYPNLNLYAYDVCNECMNDSNGGPRTGGYNNNNGNSPWVMIYGDNSFIDSAFKYARMYAPSSCHLFYNDYNEYASFKRDAILKTATRIKAAGNLDGVGMQSHINANANDGWSGENAYLTAMKMYLEAGLEVQVTELDISVENGKYTDQQQASRYANILKYAVNWNASHPDGARVTLFQVWGPNDGHSWLKSGSNALLYTSQNQPKAAYTALQQVVPQSEWGDGTKFAGDAPIKEPELDENGYWFHYTFENGTENFSGRGGSETLTSSSAASYAGSKSLSVSGRTAAWHGAATTLNSRVFKGGEKYSFSAAVQLASGSSVETVHFTMQYKNSAGETDYIKIASEDCPKGEWVQLADTEFQIPSGASDCVIYVECDGEDSSYYIDEVIGAPAGTVIKGPGKPAQMILGDITCDGRISAADLSAGMTAFKSGKFASNTAKRAADVDQSGEFDITDLQLIRDFLLTKIKEFPVAERKVDFGQMEQSFNGITLAKSWKYDNENNPLTTQRFGADPGWMVYKDRLYIYTTNDAFEYSNGTIQTNTYDVGTINCVSSADMVNWTDHGAIPVAARNGRTKNGVASWAGASWAPDAAWKTIDGKDKFFLYFANSGGGIGVLTADSPTGPWRDPLGHALITGGSPNCRDVVWMFDPGVYYDPATDEAYIAFGGGVDGRDAKNPKTGRIAKLGKDMISLATDPKTMETPYLFEDSSLIKIGDVWYYSYCSNWSGGGTVNGVSFGSADIVYMTSTDPLTNWGSGNVKGVAFKNTGTQKIDKGGNNHHSIMYFKGEYYVAYHSRQQEMRMNNGNDRNYRSTQINKATFNSGNGTITCNGDMKGCSQIEDFNPYETVQATTMAQQGGIEVEGLGDKAYVTKIDKGDWMKIKGANFDNGCKTFTVKGSTSSGCTIKVCAGGPDGDAFAYAELKPGDSEVTFPTLQMSGKTDITFVFSGSMDFYSWSFS